MKNYVDQIKELVSPPENPVHGGSLDRFVAIENHLGIKLPSDYKETIIAYGNGYWQGFWYLLNPFTDNENLNLLHHASKEGASGSDTLSAQRYLKEIEVNYPHKIWPDEGGIFPWGITDNGGVFFWTTNGRPDEWPTIYYPSRDPEFEQYEMSLTEIIVGALSGEFPIFEEEFGGESTPEGTSLFEQIGV